MTFFRRNGFPSRTSIAVRRAGVVLAAALVCILVVTLFSGALVQSLTMRRRALDWEEREQQCLYLATSAVDRVHARLAADRSYAGEIWTPSLDNRGTTLLGFARIQVEPIAGEPGRYRIAIEARWPDEPVQRVQRTTELTIHLPNSGDAP